MEREDLDRFCERGILALVLAVLVLGPLTFGAVDPMPFLAIEALTLGAVLLWIARLWVQPRPQLLWPPVTWAVVAFVIYVAARYLTAPLEYPARGELVHVLTYALLFVIIVNNLHRQEATHVLVSVLVGLAMVISFYALYQYVTNSDRVWNVFKPYAHRGTGTYINPNHLGGFLEMILPLGLGFTLASRFKALPRILLGYAVFVIIAGLAVTVSRGAWLAAGISFMFFFGALASMRAYRLPAAALLLVIVAGGVFLIPKSRFVVHRAEQLYANGQIDDDARLDLWPPAVRIWQHHKAWGAGPAHYNYLFRLYRPQSVQLQPDHAHNDYLDALADYGIAGVALIGVALLLLAIAIWRGWRKVRPPSRDIGQKLGSNKFALVLGASMGLLAILLHSVVDFNMHIPANAISAVTLMALLAGYSRFASDRFWFRLNRWVVFGSTCILLAAGAILAIWGARSFREQRLLARAGRLSPYSAAQVSALQKAFAIEPKNPRTPLEIGEAYRRRAQEGGTHYDEQGGGDVDYRAFTTNGLTWFRTASQLNPFDANAWLGQGWCLDWLGESAAAAPCYDTAELMDPNGFYTCFRIGLHYMDQARFAAAKPWLERSMRLESGEHRMAAPYLQVANTRLITAATNDLAAELLRAENGAKPALLNR